MAASTPPTRLSTLSAMNRPRSSSYSYPLGQAAYEPPKEANPELAMAYSDYLGGVIGQGNADALPWEDWYRQTVPQPQGGLLNGLGVQMGDLMPTPTGNLGIVGQPGTVGPGGTVKPAAPAPAPARTAAPAAPPPPPRPQRPRPSLISYSDIAPTLIDTNQLRGMFAPDAGVMAGFDGQMARIDNDVNAGRGEVDRQRDFGVAQVDTLPGEYERIFGGVNQMLQGTTNASADAMRAAGQDPGQTSYAQPLGAATALVRGGFEAGVPLLKAGFGEQAQKQQGFLTQLGSSMKGDVEGQKTGYLTSVDSAGDAAVASAMGQNNSTSNQFAQFNTSNRNEVNQYNAKAQTAWAQGNFDDALLWQNMATEAGQRTIDNATKGITPGMSAAEIAAMYRPDSSKTTPKTMDELIAQYAPGDKEMSTERGKQLRSQNFQPFGNGTKTYEEALAAILGTGGDPAAVQALLAQNGAKWGKHPRAVSLAMMNAGLPINADRLAGLS